MTTISSRIFDTYWHDIRDCAPISHEEEVDLVRCAKAGASEALGQLASANLRFVVSVARDFQGMGQPLSELISDGNLGTHGGSAALRREAWLPFHHVSPFGGFGSPSCAPSRSGDVW